MNIHAGTLIELKLAFLDPIKNSVEMKFPNDSFPRYVSNSPLLTEADFEKAKVVDSGDENFGMVLEVVLTKSALNKYNNASSLDGYPGLGVFVKGKAKTLFQAIHPLEEPVMWLTGLSSEEMKELVSLLQ